MTKNYSLGSSSDMRRFEKDLKSAVYEQARSALSDREFDVECPKCNKDIQVKAGLNNCPHCNAEIEFNLNFD